MVPYHKLKIDIVFGVAKSCVRLTEAGAYPQLPTQPKKNVRIQTYTAI